MTRVTAFKYNQSNHCSVSTNVFEWNCKQTTGIKSKTSEVWQLTSLTSRLTRMAERAKRSTVWLHFTKLKDKAEAKCNLCCKIISCKGGNTTSMAKHISIVHQIKAKCTTFNCLGVEKTPPPAAARQPGVHSTSGKRTHRLCSLSRPLKIVIQ